MVVKKAVRYIDSIIGIKYLTIKQKIQKQLMPPTRFVTTMTEARWWASLFNNHLN